MHQIRGTGLYKVEAYDENEYLTENFNTSEFRCHHSRKEAANGSPSCKIALFHWDLVEAVQAIRNDTNTPININSSYRCPAHNSYIDGVKNSGHIKGYAADLRTPKAFIDHYGDIDAATKAFARVIWDNRKKYGIKRVGCYAGYQKKHGFVHVGVRRKYIERRDGRILAASSWGDWNK